MINSHAEIVIAILFIATAAIAVVALNYTLFYNLIIRPTIELCFQRKREIEINRMTSEIESAIRKQVTDELIKRSQ